jgi:hypothetical protein
MQIKPYLKKFFTLRLFMGLAIGGVLGYGYYYFTGCATGGCAITSNPLAVTGFGMFFGAVMLSK